MSEQESWIRSGPHAIEPAWVDYNGHLNMAYYLVLFDRGIDALLLAAGLEPAGSGPTVFAAETQLRYLAEIGPDDRPACETAVLRVDAKRLHSWQRLVHADGRVAATCESLHLSVIRENGDPRVAPFDRAVRQRLEGRILEGPWPEGVRRPIAERGFGLAP